MITELGEEVELVEIAAWPYMGRRLSAGLVEGHSHDTVYAKFSRDSENDLVILLRTDEALALISVLSGALWSEADLALRTRMEHRTLMEVQAEQAAPFYEDPAAEWRELNP